MANEIQRALATTGDTYYAIIRDNLGRPWNVSAFEAYSTANLGAYDIPLTEQGTASRFYSATFPSAIPAGSYMITIYLRAGGAPAEGDAIQEQYEVRWDGNAAGADVSQLKKAAAAMVNKVTIDRGGATPGKQRIFEADGTTQLFSRTPTANDGDDTQDYIVGA